MKTVLALLIAIVAISNLGCTGKTAAESNVARSSSPASAHDRMSEPAEPSLLKEVDQANDKCRSSPDETAACEKRDRLMKEAEHAGWCWGPQEAFGAEKHWMLCVDDPAHTPKRQWYAHDINHANCLASSSPADKIREIQEFGQTPQTSDLSGGTVEVEVDIGNGRSRVWTFYRSMESCENSLPRSQKIDSKYE